MEDEIDNLNFAEDEENEEENYDPTNPEANKPKKKKKFVKILSENEKEKIKKTVEEMKINQIQPQITGGRVFKGPGFVSNPPKIVYKDFEIGKKMVLTVDIINVSYNFNSFHLLPLDDDIIDFFEIDYRPCGKIPAGISTKMKLTFTPLVNKDYKSYLRLKSETGMCEIPIECYCKKCLISFESENINYGEVILGQEIIKQLNVINDGALNCKYTMVDAEKNLLQNPDEDDDEENELDIEPSYKDFMDRKIILQKNDYNKANEGIDAIVMEEMKKEKVEQYKEELIQKEKDEIAQKEKEKEEQLALANANAKGKAADKNKGKKPNPKDKEPEVELINGLPVEVMNEIDKKVEEYSKSYELTTEEEKKLFNEEKEKMKNKHMKYYMLKQLTYPIRGMFDGYSKKSLSIMLNAKYIGEYSIVVLLKIEYKNQIEFKQFNISFSVVDFPIYSEKKIYELDHIIYDTIFREKITLVNNSPMPYKLQVFFHKDLKDYIELNPNLGYIQAHSTFDVWLKLKVDRNVSNLIGFFKAKNTEDNNEYNFPLKIVLGGVQIPLISVIHFFATNDTIKISEKMINYGKRFLDESTKVKVSLENNSALPMKYGFIMLPKEFTVRTNIDNLLSKEKTFVDIIYEPKDDFLGHREGDLFCRVVTDELTCQNIKIKYHIELINPELKLTPKKVHFESIAEGESKEIRLTIFNKSELKSFDCEFLTPPKCISGLTIMPKVFTIEPKGYTTCVMRYDAAFREYGPFSYEEVEKEIGIKLSDGVEQMEKEEPIKANENKLIEDKVKADVESKLNAANDAGDKKKKGAAKEQKKEVKKIEPKKDKKALEEEERKKKEEEERALKEIEEKKEKRIKEFNKEEELKHFGAECIYKDTENDRSAHWKFIIPLFYRNHIDKSDNPNLNEVQLKTSFLEVHTTCVEKLLVFDKTEIDFGEVSVQNRKTVNLVLTNNSDKVAKLKQMPLILTNCFSIVNAIRDIPPHQSFNFIVEFIPIKDLPYYDEFTVYTNEQTSTCKLKGIGVQPEVETTVKDGLLFLGNCVVNNTIEKTFDIINKSNFKINYNLTSLKSGKKNKTGLKPFCYIPFCGEIEANGKVTIKVIFNGDHQDFENYFDFILVDVPNQKVENKILISAYCWERQVYWKELTEIKFPDEKFMSKTIEQDYFVDSLKLKSNSPSSNNNKITLVFTPETPDDSNKENKDTNANEDKERCFKRKIVIGNCKLNDPKSEKNGSYEIILNKDDAYFTCDNPKGGVNGGTETVISFNFKKPNPDPITKDIDCLKGVGMWVTSKAELKISGGFIQAGATDAVTIEIFLKAYVEQI